MSLSQPIDQGVLELLKLTYHCKQLLMVLIAGTHTGKNITESLKNGGMLILLCGSLKHGMELSQSDSKIVKNIVGPQEQ